MPIRPASQHPTTSDPRFSLDSIPSGRSSFACSRGSGSTLESYIDGLESPESKKSPLETLLCFLMAMETLLDQKDLDSKKLRQKLLNEITETYDGAIEGGSNLKSERERILGLESPASSEVKRELANTIHDKLLHTLSSEGPGSIPAELIKSLQELLKSAKEIEVKNHQGNPEVEEEFNNVLIALTGLIIILGFFTFSHSTYEFTKAILSLGIHQPTVNKTNSHYKNSESTSISNENSEALQREFWEKIKALFAEYQRLLQETKKAEILNGKRKAEHSSNIQGDFSENNALINNEKYLEDFLKELVKAGNSLLNSEEVNDSSSEYSKSATDSSDEKGKRRWSEDLKYNKLSDKNSTEVDVRYLKQVGSFSAPNSVQGREKPRRLNIINTKFNEPFLSQDASNQQQKNKKTNTFNLKEDDSTLPQVGNDSGIGLQSSPILKQEEAIFTINNKNTSRAFSDADSSIDKKKVAADPSDSTRYISSEEDSQIIPSLSIKNRKVENGSTSSIIIKKSNIVNLDDDISAQLEVANQRLEKAKKGYEDRIFFLKTKIQILDSKYKQYKNEKNSLEQEISNLSDIFEEICVRLEQWQDNLTSQLTDTEDKYATAQALAQDLRQEIETMQSKLEEVELKIAAAEQEKNRLQKELDQANQISSEEREKYKEVSLSLQTEVDNSRLAVAAHAKEIEAMRLLNQEFVTTQPKLEAVEQEKNHLKVQLHEANQFLNEERKENFSQQAEMQGLYKIIAERDKALQSLSEKLEQSEKENIAQQAEADALRKALARKNEERKENFSQQAEMQGLHKIIAKRDEALQSLSEKLKQSEKENFSQQAEMQGLHKIIAERDKALARKDQDSNEKDLLDLKNEYNAQFQFFEREKEEILEREKQNFENFVSTSTETYENAIVNLEKKIEDLEEQKNEIEKTLEEVIQEVIIEKADLNSEKQKYFALYRKILDSPSNKEKEILENKRDKELDNSNKKHDTSNKRVAFLKAEVANLEENQILLLKQIKRLEEDLSDWKRNYKILRGGINKPEGEVDQISDHFTNNNRRDFSVSRSPIENEAMFIDEENISQKENFIKSICSIDSEKIDYDSIAKYISLSFEYKASKEKNNKIGGSKIFLYKKKKIDKVNDAIREFKNLLDDKKEGIFEYLRDIKELYKKDEKEFKNAEENANIFISMHDYYVESLHGNDVFYLDSNSTWYFYNFINKLKNSLEDIKCLEEKRINFLKDIADLNISYVIKCIDFWERSEDSKISKFWREITDSNELAIRNSIDFWFASNSSESKKAFCQKFLEKFKEKLKKEKLDVAAIKSYDLNFANVLLNILYCIGYFYEINFSRKAMNSIYIGTSPGIEFKELTDELTKKSFSSRLDGLLPSSETTIAPE